MKIIEGFSSARVLCIGDVMIDEFVSGKIGRISPESPVPVFTVESRETSPGGAANVARNISSLGGVCTIIGVVGDDSGGRTLNAELGSLASISCKLVICRDRPTTRKTRYVVRGQHVLRTDSEVTSDVPSSIEAELLHLIRQHIDEHEILVLSDYAKGTLTARVVRDVITLARRKAKIVVVDPKSRDFTRYRGATVITPNVRELEVSTGIELSSDNEVVAEAATQALKQSVASAILVTRSEYGMTLVRRGFSPVHIESAAREVFDVVGAGDTVVAALALCLAAGATIEEAAHIANVAAGIAVSRHGTSTVNANELLRAVAEQNRSCHASSVSKVLNRSELLRAVQSWKSAGLKVGFTNGCFDILHPGHVRLMGFARTNCDRLIVGLNTDASIRRQKGLGRPFNNQSDRAEVLSALTTVDAIVLFDDLTPIDLIAAIVPDLLVKGADYELEDIVGADLVMANGGRVLRSSLVPQLSSSALINKIQNDELL